MTHGRRQTIADYQLRGDTVGTKNARRDNRPLKATHPFAIEGGDVGHGLADCLLQLRAGLTSARAAAKPPVIARKAANRRDQIVSQKLTNHLQHQKHSGEESHDQHPAPCVSKPWDSSSARNSAASRSTRSGATPY